MFLIKYCYYILYRKKTSLVLLLFFGQLTLRSQIKVGPFQRQLNHLLIQAIDGGQKDVLHQECQHKKITWCPYCESFCDCLQFGLYGKGQLGFFHFNNRNLKSAITFSDDLQGFPFLQIFNPQGTQFNSPKTPFASTYWFIHM